MQNPFKIASLELESPPKLCIKSNQVTGMILLDKQYEFSKKITDKNGNPINIDQQNDVYVSVHVDSESRMTSSSLLSLGYYLPSTLFNDCKEGDYIAFQVNGTPYQFKLEQGTFRPGNYQRGIGTDTGTRFEKVLASVKAMTLAKNVVLNPEDNIIDGKSNESYFNPKNNLILPFFGKQFIRVVPPIYISLNGEPEKAIGVEEYKKLAVNIPDMNEYPLLTYGKNSNDSINIELAGANLQNISYLRSSNFLYIWVKKCEEGKLIFQGIPECRVLKLDDANWFTQPPVLSIQNGILHMQTNPSLTLLQDEIQGVTVNHK